MADAAAMRRALELATRGPSRGVNPRVGCVILSTRTARSSPRAGTAAPAPPTPRSTRSRSSLRGRPKARPPSSRSSRAITPAAPARAPSALIDAGVARVVYAVADPGDHSSGGGAHVCARPASRSPAACSPTRRRPFSATGCSPPAIAGRPCIVKWASSLDGRAAAADGTQPVDHRPGRSRPTCTDAALPSDAIAVGTGTVLADDPALTARATPASRSTTRSPMPVVFGRARGAGRRGDAPATRTRPCSSTGTDLAADLADLQRRGIRSLFVEGGPTLASAFIAAGLVDEYCSSTSPRPCSAARALALGDLGIDIHRRARDAPLHRHRTARRRRTARRPPDPSGACAPRPAQMRGTDMFTGIIEERGRASRASSAPTTPHASPCAGRSSSSDAKHGDSISV